MRPLYPTQKKKGEMDLSGPRPAQVHLTFLLFREPPQAPSSPNERLLAREK